MNRLVDVLDETLPDKLFWDKVFAKLGLLQAKIESENNQKSHRENNTIVF